MTKNAWILLYLFFAIIITVDATFFTGEDEFFKLYACDRRANILL